MSDGRVEVAAANNAHWYDTLCKAHGCACGFVADAWLTRGTPPPYHSNMVTMRGGDAVAAQQQLIRDIIRDDPERAFGFKDSFGCLDAGTLIVEPRGRQFQVLFEAEWIWLERTRFKSRSTSLCWSEVASEGELLEWERAWRGDSANDDAPIQARQFPPSLLEDSSMVFLAGRHATGERAGRIVAVAAANRSDGAIGLSNVFGSGVALSVLWPEATAAAMGAFLSNLPIVGYERHDDLAAACAVGFEQVGRLRVLTRSP